MSRKNQLMALCGFICTMLIIFSFAGCAKKAVSAGPSGQEITAESKTAAQSGAAVSNDTSGAAAGSAAKADTTAAASSLTEYTVKCGDSLWFIAKYKDIYDDDFLWPIIFEANKGQIKNPNLIYPGQKLKIPRDGYTMDDIKKARKKAGAKKPYTPPKESKPPMK